MWNITMLQPGADDDGSRSVTLLRTIEYLASIDFRPYKRALRFEFYSAEEWGLYGSLAMGAKASRDGDRIRMKGMVEKPPRGEAPSNLSISGRYILQPEIFGILENQPRGAGGEIQLTDGMARLMKDQTFTAVEYEGVTHDCGDKIGLLQANVALALKRPDLGDAARAAITALL